MSLAPSPELTVLGLAAILQAGQIGLAAWSMNRDGLSKWNAGPRDALERLVRASFQAIHDSRDQVAIYQDEIKHLQGIPRFDYLELGNREFRDMWIEVLEAGQASGAFRADLDPNLTYRFMRDTVWVAVRWYRPGGKVSQEEIADQYLRIVLDGLADD